MWCCWGFKGRLPYFIGKMWFCLDLRIGSAQWTSVALNWAISRPSNSWVKGSIIIYFAIQSVKITSHHECSEEHMAHIEITLLKWPDTCETWLATTINHYPRMLWPSLTRSFESQNFKGKIDDNQLWLWLGTNWIPMLCDQLWLILASKPLSREVG